MCHALRRGVLSSSGDRGVGLSVFAPDLQLTIHLAPDTRVAPEQLAAVVTAGALRQEEGGGHNERCYTLVNIIITVFMLLFFLTLHALTNR